MGYRLRLGLHACRVDRSTVFLDVRSDRYFALTGATSDAFLRLVANEEVSPADRVLIEDLLRRDVIIESAGASIPILCPPAPDVHDHESSGAEEMGYDSSTKFGEVAVAFVRQVSVVAELKMTSFGRVLGNVGRYKKAISKAPSREISPYRATQAFANVDRVIGSHGRCLPRSVALARTLIAGGSKPLLILGVKLRPFEAHCWIQIGNRLIGDHPGRVAPFTPILII